MVAVDELVIMMCMGCPLLITPHTTFERTMLLHADILTDPETSHVVSDTTVSLPSFLTEGMFKSIALAGWKPTGLATGTEIPPNNSLTQQQQGSKRHVHYASNDGSSSSGGAMNGAGDEIDRFVKLNGPHKTLSPVQIQWLTQQTKPMAWKLSLMLDQFSQSDRVNEVFRPTFGMILPPVESVVVAPVSMSNEEQTVEGEGGAEGDGSPGVSSEANDVTNEGGEEGAISEDQPKGEGNEGQESNDTENDANEEEDNESIEGQGTSVIKGSALDSTSLSRGSGVPIPHAGLIHAVGQQAQFLELSNDVYCTLSEVLTSDEFIPFCV